LVRAEAREQNGGCEEQRVAYVGDTFGGEH
jgi:hypothetical protein